MVSFPIGSVTRDSRVNGETPPRKNAFAEGYLFPEFLTPQVRGSPFAWLYEREDVSATPMSTVGDVAGNASS
jgi:hypothetical protein